MAIDEVKNIYTNKVDKLTKAVALLEQAAANKENRPQNNHQEEESNNSKSEDKEPSPPPKKKTRKKKKATPTPAPSIYTGGKTFKMDWAYKPGMAFDASCSRQKKATYIAARQEFLGSGTKEAQKDKVSRLKEVCKRKKAEGNMETYRTVKEK